MGGCGGRRFARARRGRGGEDRGRIRAAAARDRSRGSAQGGRAARSSCARLERALPPQVHLGARRGGVRERRAQDRLPRGLGPQRHRADRNLRRRCAVGRGDGNPRRLGLDPDAQVPRPGRARAAPAGQRGARAPRRRRRRQLRREARLETRRAGRLPGEEARRTGSLHRGPPREPERRRHAGAGPLLRHGGGVRRGRRDPRDEDPRGGRHRRLRRPRAFPARSSTSRPR